MLVRSFLVNCFEITIGVVETTGLFYEEPSYNFMRRLNVIYLLKVLCEFEKSKINSCNCFSVFLRYICCRKLNVFYSFPFKGTAFVLLIND